MSTATPSKLSDQETLQAILAHGLSIRQVPLKVVSTFELRHKQPGDEEVLWHGRKMCRRTRVPDHAGWWMCQAVRNTSSKVEWSTRIHHLAPTLAESVGKYLEGVATKPAASE